MEIKIITDVNGPEVILTDEGLNNPNFVGLVVKDESGECLVEVDIAIDEFLPALDAFQNKRILDARRNNNYKE